MKRLSKPLPEMAAAYDAIIVGSGYGGGAAASRLARMGLKVAVLERGAEWHPGEFPDTPVEAVDQVQIEGRFGRVGKRTALFDFRVGDDINVLVGCGLGGTSLINANVSLRADLRVFEGPVWPATLRAEHGSGDLQEGFARAETMLKPQSYPDDGVQWPHLNKLEAMKTAAAALGTNLEYPPLNVSFEAGYNSAGVWQPACNLCGDCCSGCNTGAKSTTLMNYLPDAAAFGAEIFCGVRVRSVRKRKGGGWNVHYVPERLGRERFDAGEPILPAGIVVLAAGALGSTEILLRSHDQGLELSQSLGRRFSGNGDVLAFGYNNDMPIDGIGFGVRSPTYDWRSCPERPVGPTIAGLIDLREGSDVEHGMVIEEGAIPGGTATFLPPVMAATSTALGDDTDQGDVLEESAREVESLLFGAYRGAVNHTQTFLAMSHDGADGSMELKEDRLQVVWQGVGEKPSFSRVADNIRAAVAATGGTYVPNPIWTEAISRNLVTVHPLGGCPMGEDAQRGVVDDQCRVFSGAQGEHVHEGLYVCDGAVLPRSLGVNPLLTITAIAERAMIKLARARGLTIDMTPAARQAPVDPLRMPVGIRFTEKMTGTVTPAAGGSSSPAHFVVTVVATDAERLLMEKEHEADLIGTVHVPALSRDPLTVSAGRFNLFTVATDQAATKQMKYRMPLTAADGARYFFFGRKLIHNDPGFDIWSDTTSLFIQIHNGPDDSGRLLYERTLKIPAKDFVRQLATIEVTGAPNILARLNMVRRFSLFFAGQLFDSYAGLGADTTRAAPNEALGPSSGSL